MLIQHKCKIIVSLIVLTALILINFQLELFALHPFKSNNKEDIKVFCLNVHSTGEGFVGRSNNICTAIMDESPDFVFLTEYYDTCSTVLDRILREQYEYYQRGIRGDFNLTECIYSNWQIDSINNIHIDKESDKAKKYLEANPIIKQHLYHSAILRCQISKNSKKVIIYTSHLKSNNYFKDVDTTAYHWPKVIRKIERRWLAYDFGSKLRELEAEAICKDAKSADCPVIVLGDMNDFNKSTSLKLFEEFGFKDAWWEEGFGFGCTFRDSRFRLRIDHILYSNELNPTKVKVLDSKMSDHKPLVAKFRFN